ncbi:hypothetical protein IMZ48_15115, partial [Candidatus Bathyarchaeota archaeon]|nr:hypothetical protein [Candidatus Bathyarchaeota archaeon]
MGDTISVKSLAKHWKLYPTPESAKKQSVRDAVVLHFQVGISIKNESEVIGILLLDKANCKHPLVKSLVWPNTPMMHYNTKYTTIQEGHMARAKREGNIIQGAAAAREAVHEFVGPNTIIMGYALHDGLRALRMLHQRVHDVQLGGGLREWWEKVHKDSYAVLAWGTTSKAEEEKALQGEEEAAAAEGEKSQQEEEAAAAGSGDDGSFTPESSGDDSVTLDGEVVSKAASEAEAVPSGPVDHAPSEKPAELGSNAAYEAEDVPSGTVDHTTFQKLLLLASNAAYEEEAEPSEPVDHAPSEKPAVGDLRPVLKMDLVPKGVRAMVSAPPTLCGEAVDCAPFEKPVVRYFRPVLKVDFGPNGERKTASA